MDSQTIYINGDGGSRGNPGPAASAISVSQKGEEIYKAARYLGIETNNVAEYTSVIMGLEWVRDTVNEVSTKVIFQLDSELVTKHITGEYKVRSPHLLPLYNQVRVLLLEIPNQITFSSVPRDQNSIADLYVNQELDAQKR